MLGQKGNRKRSGAERSRGGGSAAAAEGWDWGLGGGNEGVARQAPWWERWEGFLWPGGPSRPLGGPALGLFLGETRLALSEGPARERESLPPRTPTGAWGEGKGAGGGLRGRKEEGFLYAERGSLPRWDRLAGQSGRRFRRVSGRRRGPVVAAGRPRRLKGPSASRGSLEPEGASRGRSPPRSPPPLWAAGHPVDRRRD